MIMKKVLLYGVCAVLLMSSCGSYEASGAATGAHFGSIIGSAIGGITGGWRGSDVGQLVGLAGGAMVGAAIGHATEKKAEARAEQRYQEHKARYAASRNQQMNPAGNSASNFSQDNGNSADGFPLEEQDGNYDSGFDPSNSGDDRITFEPANGFSSLPPAVPAEVQVRNARLIDDGADGVLHRGEQAKMVFEVYNPSTAPVFNVQPSVIEVTGNKHIRVSENILVESIAPKGAIRYTASIKADKSLRNGQAVIRICVLQNNKEVAGQAQTFTLQTRK